MNYTVKKIYKDANGQQNKTLVDVEFFQKFGEDTVIVNNTLEFVDEESFDLEKPDADYFKNFISPAIHNKIRENNNEINKLIIQKYNGQ